MDTHVTRPTKCDIQKSPQLICPRDECLDTFLRSSNLKSHVLLHLRCRWYRCPYCPTAFFYQANAVAHVGVCTSHEGGAPPGPPRECFDARYPLLRVWSLGMRLPEFKEDGSGDAFMVAGEGVVWQCAKNSKVVQFGPLPAANPNVELAALPTVTETDDSIP